MVKPGDTLPSVPLQEGAPDKTVDLSKELKNGYLIGVPGKCSTQHEDESRGQPYYLGKC